MSRWLSPDTFKKAETGHLFKAVTLLNGELKFTKEDDTELTPITLPINTGPQGPQGNTGDTGANGARGNAWLGGPHGHARPHGHGGRRGRGLGARGPSRPRDVRLLIAHVPRSRSSSRRDLPSPPRLFS